MKKIEIETQQNPDRPNCEWQLLVDGDCVAGGEEETDFEAVQRAANISYKYDRDPNSRLFVNGVQV